MKYLSRDYRRERLRKEFAKYEIDRMCQRYDDECGECITRQATVGELNKVERKTHKLKHIWITLMLGGKKLKTRCMGECR